MIYIATRNTSDLGADNEVIEEVRRELDTEAWVSAEEAWGADVGLTSFGRLWNRRWKCKREI